METRTNTREVTRLCSVCERKIAIGINKGSGGYTGGHYFGSVKLRWWGRPVEYWECEGCYITEDDGE